MALLQLGLNKKKITWSHAIISSLVEWNWQMTVVKPKRSEDQGMGNGKIV